jgi:hypothetical protein
MASKKVTAWLEELGLGQYADAFAENELDFDQLVDLSNEDMKDLGVTIIMMTCSGVRHSCITKKETCCY